MNSTLTHFTILGFLDSFLTNLVKSILAVEFSLAFSLNLYIIVLLLSKSRGVDVSVVFLLNSTAAEVLYSIMCLLYAVFLENTSFVISELLNFLFVTSMSARHLFLCCVCLERYLAVVHPVIFLKCKPLRYRVVCSVSAWICALGMGISTSLFYSFYTGLAVMMLSILAVEFFCCVLILKKLRHPGPRVMEREQREICAVKKKAFQIVFINLLLSLTQNLPVAVSYILQDILSEYNTFVAAGVSTAVNFLLGFVQPFFILHKAGKLSFTRCS